MYLEKGDILELNGIEVFVMIPCAGKKRHLLLCSKVKVCNVAHKTAEKKTWGQRLNKKHMAYSRNHGLRFDCELFIIEEGINV